MIFISTTLLHEIFMTHLNGFWYCASDAVTALFTLIILSRLQYSDFIYQLMTACIMVILFSFAGWIIYELYLPVSIINACFVALYLYVCGLIYLKGKHEKFKLNSGDSFFCFSFDESNCDPIELQTKA